MNTPSNVDTAIVPAVRCRPEAIGAARRRREASATNSPAIQASSMSWLRSDQLARCGVDVPPTGVLVGVRVPGRRTSSSRRAPPRQRNGTRSDGVVLDRLTRLQHRRRDRDEARGRGNPRPRRHHRRLAARALPTLTGSRSGCSSTHPRLGATIGSILGRTSLADLERRWTSGEAVATLKDRGARSRARHVRSEETGTGMLRTRIHRRTGHRRSLADLVTSTITQPAGLDHSFLSNGTDLPDNYQHGRFFVEGSRYTARRVPSPPISPTHQPRPRSCQPSPTC